MTSSDPSWLLRISLRANAGFSTLSGLVFATAGAPVAAFLGGVGSAEVVGVGVQLLVFAAFLAWLSLRPSIPVAVVFAVIAADLAWVVGTVGVVFADLFSREGTLAAIAIANVVLVFAVAQWLGVRRLRQTAPVA